MSKSVSTNVFKKKSGIQNIQQYLEGGRSITALEALSNFGIFRLASAIEILRKRGLNIQTERKEDPNGKVYARYTLVEKAAEVKPEEVTPPELKAGDKVVIKAGVDDDFYRAGDVGSITRVGEYDLYVTFESGYALAVVKGIKDWYVAFEDVELIPEEEPKAEPEVGDRVRATVSVCGIDKGTFGTVKRVLPQGIPYPFYVAFDGDCGSRTPCTAAELEAI